MGWTTLGAPRETVIWLRDKLKIKHFVESGTYLGDTADWASKNFSSVSTVERYEPLYRKAIERFRSQQNVKLYFGDSRVHIRTIVDSLTEPAIFWLDAHWSGAGTFGENDECPLMGELEAVNVSRLPHVILIDDARQFLAPPPPPHAPEHWPGIIEILQAVESLPMHRYVAVHDDVIFGVPESAKSQFVVLLSQAALEAKLAREALPPRKSVLRRALAKADRTLEKIMP
jgi:hypothetical protein